MGQGASVTAELVVGNAAAMVMAADSLLTVQTEGGYNKSFRTNKITRLAGGDPVALMYHGRARFCGLPWERVAAQYREERPARRATVDAYARDFLTWLGDTSYLTPAMRRADWESGVSALRRGLPGGSAARGFPATDDEAPEGDQPIQLSRRSLRERQRAVPSVNSADDRPVPTTGLVFAGFGGDETFPAVTAVTGVYTDGIGTYFEEITAEQVSPETPSMLDHFAQSEDIEAFLTGSHPSVRRPRVAAHEGVRAQLPGLVRDLLDRPVQGLIPARQADLDTALSDLALGLLKVVVLEQEKAERQMRADILAGIAHMSIEELIDLALRLIDLAGLKHRVSVAERHTVGGLAEIVVISREAGVSWPLRQATGGREKPEELLLTSPA